MRKVYLLVLSMVLLLSIAACGGSMSADGEVSDSEGSFKKERQETSLFGGKTLVASNLKKSDYEIKPEAKSVPDLGLFLGRRGGEALEYGGSGE